MSETAANASHYLAVVNMATLRPDADPQELASFGAAIDPFVARAQRDNPSLIAFVDPRESPEIGDTMFGGAETINNLTVWDGPESLVAFLQEAHQAVLRRYRGLFAPVGQAAVALWWTPAEVTPGYVEAERRLMRLRQAGPTDYAFDLATSKDFPAPR